MAISDRINEMYTHVGDVYDTITNVDVNNGKNLFDYNKITTSAYYTNNYDGSFTRNSNGSSITINVDTASVPYDKFSLKAGTYSVSFDIKTTATVTLNNFFMCTKQNDTASNLAKSIGVQIPANTTTHIKAENYVVVNNAEKVGFAGYLSASTGVVISNIQVEKGTTASKYQPYTDTPTYKNIENIPKVIRSSYLEIMNNGIDKIWNNWEKVTGEGETLTLNSTEEAPMKTDLKGNTSQETTTGKNLLNAPGQPIERTYTGSYGMFTLASDLNLSLASGSYTMSLDIKSANGGRFNKLILVDNNNNSYVWTLYKTIPTTYQYNSHTYTFENDVVIKRVDAQNAEGTETFTFNNIMLEQSSTATSYEPYTNGASPNPDYPQDIHVVSGDNTINVEGKNLFNGETELGMYNVSTGEKQINNGTRRNVDFIDVLPNTTYTLSRSGSTFNCRYMYYDENKGYINTEVVNGSITTPANCYYLNFFSDQLTSNYSNLQLEQNSTATTYEEYKGASYPINLGDIELCKIGDYQDSIKKSTGKNLFDKDNANVLDGMFINASSGNIGSNANATSIYIPINPNTTYCVSKTKGNRFAIGYSSTTPAVNASLTNIVDDRTKTSLTSTSTSDSKYLVIYISLSDTETYENIISTIQIEYGNTPTDFEPYGKIWYLNKQIGKYTITGQESATQYYWSSEINGIKFVLDDAIKTVANVPTYCNRFNQWYSGTTANNYVRLNRTTSYLGFWFGNITIEGVNSITTFKSYATNNQILLYYPLATPTYTEITDSTLLSQLEALNGARSYITQTNISQENNDKPFILDVTALKQLTQ